MSQDVNAIVAAPAMGDGPVARGVEQLLLSISRAIDRGEFAAAFTVLGVGIGVATIITALRGGNVKILNGFLSLDSPSMQS